MIHLGNVFILSTALQTPLFIKKALETPSFRKAIPWAYGSIQQDPLMSILHSESLTKNQNEGLLILQMLRKRPIKANVKMPLIRRITREPSDLPKKKKNQTNQGTKWQSAATGNNMPLQTHRFVATKKKQLNQNHKKLREWLIDRLQFCGSRGPSHAPLQTANKNLI